jgi:hypothetical protein
VVDFDKEASQTRDYCVAKNATHRAARPDPSLRKKRLLRMTSNPDDCRFCWRIDNSKLGLCESIPETLVAGNPSIIQRQRLAGNFLSGLHRGYTI